MPLELMPYKAKYSKKEYENHLSHKNEESIYHGAFCCKVERELLKEKISKELFQNNSYGIMRFYGRKGKNIKDPKSEGFIADKPEKLFIQNCKIYNEGNG